VRSHRPTMILAYHAIVRLGDDPNGVACSPERFRAQMLYLKRRNLRGVSMRELRQATKAGNSSRRLVGLTFDDGYKDFLHTALPVLEELGFSATVFVVAGMLGEENVWEHVHGSRPRLKLLTADELREASERGIEVGSHGMTHRKLPELDLVTLNKELSDSRRLLGEIVKEVVEGFAYPYGSSSEAAIAAVSRVGYAYACGWNSQDEWHQYDLPRIPVSEKDNLLRFAAKLRIYWPYRGVVNRFGKDHEA
jgi:peptidoglycan/xylan/chitin deacetylase (PgdA/CDA1 family)